MKAKDLVIGTLYLYEGRPVRLVGTQCLDTPEGHNTKAIIDTGAYAFLYVKPEKLEPCYDLQKAIDVC